MNASQRRIARRAIISAHPIGSQVTLATGKPATVIGAKPAGNGLIVKRGDNRKVEYRPA